MLNSIEQLFYEPMKEENNFVLIKDNTNYQDFINIYEQIVENEGKIQLLNSLKTIFSHPNSRLNISIFCSTNNNDSLNLKLNKNDSDNEENLDIDKSYFHKNNNFINWIIDEYFSQNNEEIKQCLNEILLFIIPVIGIDKYNISKAYEELSKLYFYSEQNIDIAKFFCNLKFLSTLYYSDNKNIDLKNKINYKPYNYYYFKGKEEIQINPIITSIEKTKINDGLSIFFCFNCLLSSKYNINLNKENKSKESILISIHLNNNYKLILSIDNDMNLIFQLYDNNNKNNKDKSKKIKQIENNVWYNVSINFCINKKNKKFPLFIMINNNFINNINDIDADNIKINEINKIILCRNYIGFMTNFFLFNKIIGNEEFNYYQNNFIYGIYKCKYINNLIEKLNPNIIKNLIILLIPIQQFNNNNEIMNLANSYVNNNITNNFEIKYISEKNIIINVNINYHLNHKINLIGGIENILPFFEILIKITKDNNSIDLALFQKCIEILINLINSILINHKKNSEEISNSKFFEILCLFLQNLYITPIDKTKSEIFTSRINNSFLDLGAYLIYNSKKFPNQCKSYLNNILLNLKIITKFSLSEQFKIFEFIEKYLNSQNDINIQNLFDYENLLSIIGYYNEHYQNYLCCEEHQKLYGEKKKKSGLDKLFDLITKIIGDSMKYNEDKYIKLLHLLVIKSQPCLIKYIIINIFISNLKNNDNNKIKTNKFVKYLVKSNILNILLFLLSIYVYPDIISQIIYLFSLLSLQSNDIDNNNFFNKENIISYIANSIIPIYARIPKNTSESNLPENHSFNRNKALAASEIVFGNNEIKNNIILKNINSSSDEEDLDEYNGIIASSNKKSLSNTEKIKFKFRKQSDDNYYPNKKFSLKNASIFNFNENNDEDLENNTKKNLDYNSDSEREKNNKNGIPTVRSPRKLKSTIQNVINFGEINRKKLKNLKNKSSIESIYLKAKEEYMKLNPILDRLDNEKLLEFIQIVLDALLNWLRIDLNKNVIKIIFIFFKYEKINYSHICKFIHILYQIIKENANLKNNNLSKKLFNLDFYLWYMDIMFQFYLKKHNKNDILSNNNNCMNFLNEQKSIDIDNIFEKGLEILVYIIINMKLENKELTALFDDLLLCGTKIKKYYSLNKNNISYLNNFYLEIFKNILKEYHKYHSFPNTAQLIIIINICYEYMLFFNNENKSEEINNFIINDNQMFNGILLSGIITNNLDSHNSSISVFWNDYSLFETILNSLKQIINIKNIDYKNDEYLEEHILSHKKSDTFLDNISFLCNCQKGNNSNINSINSNENFNFDEDIKNGEIPIIYLISNLYVISLNLVNNKDEKIQLLNGYKSFIIFLIISSSNLSYNPPFSNIIQYRVQLVLNYFIGYIIERCNNSQDKDFLIACLNEVFILMIKVLKRAYKQIQNRKSSTKILNRIMSLASNQKKIDFKQCAVYKIMSKGKMANTFNKNFVYEIKKKHFEYFDDKTYLIKLLISSLDLISIRKETKNIFFADRFIKKGHKRILEVNKIKNKEYYNEKENENCYNIQFFKTRKKINSIIENAIFAFEEEIKIHNERFYLEKLLTQNHYKKIKKNIFSFTGLWSNKDIFYYNDIEDEISEDFNDNENDLDTKFNNNIYKNKYILKYKLINHYGRIPFRPVLSPIYDINAYLPSFSLFNKDNLFIEKKEAKSITSVINLDLDEIFNNKNNSFSFLNFTEKEEDESIISKIYQNIFPKAYNYYQKEILPNFISDKLLSSPLSGLISDRHHCCYVIQMSHIKGYLYLYKSYCSFIQNIYDDEINENKLKEDEDYNEEKKMCYGSYLKLNKSKFIYIDIKYKSIQYIFLRRYYYKDSAIEIFTSKNKVYYFNFQDSSKRQNALNSLLKHFSVKKEIKILKNKIVGYDVSLSNNYFNINSNNNQDFLSNLIEKWQDWNISTFEFLLWMNILSNRSFNDISQYPVFPWILIKYDDEFSKDTNNKMSISKSVMTNIFKSKFNTKNISASYFKSNSDEIKNKNMNYSKDKKENENIENKNEIEFSNENPNDNEKNIYDQFILDKKDKSSNIILSNDIRNFSLPMGMMSLTENGQKRKDNYLSKFSMSKKEFELNEKENKNSTNNNKLYIYGSHYSNPLYVCHYLTRIFPYSNISIELQGDKFDDPNRLLISVSKSFEGSSSHEGDVRELLPEFFYLPEIFENQNNLDLKIKSKNLDNSNDVTLPNWANNNKYIFITKLKTYLESEEVNKSINTWIDLIFGYKQKGKEAELANNLFLPSSYDNFDIAKETPEKKQYYLVLTEFGLTPHQIINKKFSKKKQKDNKKKAISEIWREKEPKIKDFAHNKKDDDKINNLEFLKFKFIDDENIIAILNNYQFTKYEITQFQYATERVQKFDSNAKNYVKKEKISKLNLFQIKNYKQMNKSYPIIIYEKGGYIAQGGFLNGIIIVNQINTKNKSKNSKNVDSLIINSFEVINNMDKSPVVSLIINKNEKTILSGSMLGSVVIYSNKKDSWKKKSQINDHLNMPITSLYFNDNLNLWGSACYDGYVNLYTFPSNKKICSIKVENNLYADYIFIISAPLPCFVIHCKNNFCFYTFSLIGKLIFKSYENNSEILSPLIIRESNFGEVLIYANDIGKICMRFLPSLNLFLNQEINDEQIYQNHLNFDLIEVSQNGNYCIAWNNEYNKFYIFYDQSLISENEELLILHLANDLDE